MDDNITNFRCRAGYLVIDLEGTEWVLHTGETAARAIAFMYDEAAQLGLERLEGMRQANHATLEQLSSDGYTDLVAEATADFDRLRAIAAGSGEAEIPRLADLVAECLRGGQGIQMTSPQFNDYVRQHHPGVSDEDIALEFGKQFGVPVGMHDDYVRRHEEQVMSSTLR